MIQQHPTLTDVQQPQRQGKMSIRFIIGNTSDPVTSYYTPAPALPELAESIPTASQWQSACSENHVYPTQAPPGHSTQVEDLYHCGSALLRVAGSFSSGIERTDDSAGGGILYPRNVVSSLSSIGSSHIGVDSSLMGATRTCSTTSVGTYSYYTTPYENISIDHTQQQPSRSRSRRIFIANDTKALVTRAARPSHTEEQKYFIMYHHLIQKLAWTEIEPKYARFFEPCTIAALTSVYYRIRQAWGMKKVNDTTSEDRLNDRRIVERKARSLSRDFLNKLG